MSEQHVHTQSNGTPVFVDDAGHVRYGCSLEPITLPDAARSAD